MLHVTETGPMGGNLRKVHWISVLGRVFQHLDLSLGDGFLKNYMFPISGNVQAEAG